MSWRRILLALSLVIGGILAVTLLAVANWPPLVCNTGFRLVEDGFSTLIVRALARPGISHGASPETGGGRLGRLAVFEPAELVRLWQSGQCPPRGAFTVLANTPASYQWFAPGYRRWLLGASTEAAVALGLDAVIDASSADALRAEPGGRETAVALRQAGVLRAVIFDGAHHLPALTLEPDLAILPVIRVAGISYACHVHTRDAVSVPSLQAWSTGAGLRTVFCTTPRLWTLAKTKRSMAELLAEALAACGPVPHLKGIEERRHLPSAPGGMIHRQNARELYTARIGLALGISRVPAPAQLEKGGRHSRPGMPPR